MSRVLLIDRNTVRSERLASYLRRRGLAVTVTETMADAVRRLHRRQPSYEIVVLLTSVPPDQGFAILRRLKQACQRTWFFHRPLFLFVSQHKIDPPLRLRIERMGVRYVRSR